MCYPPRRCSWSSKWIWRLLWTIFLNKNGWFIKIKFARTVLTLLLFKLIKIITVLEFDVKYERHVLYIDLWDSSDPRGVRVNSKCHTKNDIWTELYIIYVPPLLMNYCDNVHIVICPWLFERYQYRGNIFSRLSKQNSANELVLNRYRLISNESIYLSVNCFSSNVMRLFSLHEKTLFN